MELCMKPWDGGSREGKLMPGIEVMIDDPSHVVKLDKEVLIESLRLYVGEGYLHISIRQMRNLRVSQSALS